MECVEESREKIRVKQFSKDLESAFELGKYWFEKQKSCDIYHTVY